jgi:hypothetical protein
MRRGGGTLYKLESRFDHVARNHLVSFQPLNRPCTYNKVISLFSQSLLFKSFNLCRYAAGQHRVQALHGVGVGKERARFERRGEAGW